MAVGNLVVGDSICLISDLMELVKSILAELGQVSVVSSGEVVGFNSNLNCLGEICNSPLFELDTIIVKLEAGIGLEDKGQDRTGGGCIKVVKWPVAVVIWPGKLVVRNWESILVSADMLTLLLLSKLSRENDMLRRSVSANISVLVSLDRVSCENVVSHRTGVTSIGHKLESAASSGDATSDKGTSVAVFALNRNLARSGVRRNVLGDRGIAKPS